MKNKIKGVGMIEVLISLLILSIAILGFTALQLRAVKANQVALQTVQAMNIARDLAERMRVNRTQRTEYQTFANSSQTGAISATSCVNTTLCSAENFSHFDIKQIFDYASDQGFHVDIRGCGAASTRQCIFVAWDDTVPRDSSSIAPPKPAEGETAPPDTNVYCTTQGVYTSGSACVVLEAY